MQKMTNMTNVFNMTNMTNMNPPYKICKTICQICPPPPFNMNPPPFNMTDMLNMPKKYDESEPPPKLYVEILKKSKILKEISKGALPQRVGPF